MKPTHIATFRNKENIITEIRVISQSKVRNITTELFHYANYKGIGDNKVALRYFRMINRKNGKWTASSFNPLDVCRTYYRNN